MELDVNWKNWLVKSLLKGCDKNELFKMMLDNGFSHETCKKALGGFEPNKPLEHIIIQGRHKHIKPIDPFASANAKITMSKNKSISNHSNEKIQLYCWDGFLGEEDCQLLCDLADSQVRPSSITDKIDDKQYRTSETCDLAHQGDPVIHKVNEMMIEAMGVPREWSEAIQIQRYKVGQQFKAHADYFRPGTSDFVKYANTMGQRSWTFMVYLNDTDEGGETEFVELGIKFKPKRGTALIWNNLKKDGRVNPDTQHQAHPVLKGRKYVITKWFRLGLN